MIKNVLSAARTDGKSARSRHNRVAPNALAATTPGKETTYSWRHEPNQLSWQANAADILGVRNITSVSNQQQYELLIAPEHVARRQRIFTTDHGEDRGTGVPYSICYRFAPGGPRSRKSIWIAEQGTWWADETGQPVRATGRIRVLNGPLEPEASALGDYDELTGQLNRACLIQALAAVIDRTQISHTNSALLVVAINNLSVINDTFGFDVGDEVLARVAKVLNGRLRSGDSLGRYSSNKFAILINDCGPNAMRVAADRLIKAAYDTDLEGIACPIKVMLSVGGILLPDHATSVNKALSRALRALNRAQRRPGSNFEAHTRSENQEAARRRTVCVAEEVCTALDEKRMHLLLQPVVASSTRRPAFHECLLRMTRPDGTIVSAGDFIEVAEQLGFSKQIDQFTLSLTADLLKSAPNLRLSMNASSLTCVDHDWLIDLYNLVGYRRQLAERLIIEITETAAMQDIDQSIAFVNAARDMGCTVAIDDFGSGYSSFKALKDLPVNMVKIDGTFVRNLTSDPTDRIFLKTMAELANSLDLETVAEFVIDEPTAKIAEASGISYLQGFHLGQPRMPHEILNEVS